MSGRYRPRCGGVPAKVAGGAISEPRSVADIKERNLVPDTIWSHPMLVHVPLVLIPVAVVFALVDLARPRHRLRIVALALLLGGVGGAVLAASTGEEAQQKAEAAAPAVDRIMVGGQVPRTLGNGALLKTHAQLGELTRNLYGALLFVEAGFIFAVTPAFARFRRGWTLSPRVERVGRRAWMAVAVAGLAIVVLTGHYGGSLVYDHGVGVPTPTVTAAQAR